MSRFFTKTAVAVAAILLSAAAHGQGGPLQITQIMTPPGTADLKPQTEAKKLAKPTAKRHAAAPKAVPVDADKAASAAGAKIAAAAKAAKPVAGTSNATTIVPGAKAKLTRKPAARPKSDVSHRAIPPVKKVRGKKGAKSVPPSIGAIVPPTPTHLTGDAAWAKLVGNSISGSYNGQFLTDAYLPDNTVKSRIGGEITTGRWGLVDGRICFQYQPEPQATCYAVAVDGDDVAYTDDEGEVFHFALAPGIPPGM